MKANIIAEATLIDLNDAELKELLGYLHEAVKRLTEDMKKDPDIQQMKAQLQAYMQDNYKEEIKRLNAKLKAARVQAHARGIKWTPPAQE